MHEREKMQLRLENQLLRTPLRLPRQKTKTLLKSDEWSN